MHLGADTVDERRRRGPRYHRRRQPLPARRGVLEQDGTRQREEQGGEGQALHVVLDVLDEGHFLCTRSLHRLRVER